VTKREFHVEVKAVSLTYPDDRPYIVGWGHGHGFATFTEAEALAEAERFLPRDLEMYRAGVCIEISRRCATCDVTGVKPGCKRKKCPACNGRGTVDRYGFVILKPGVSVDGKEASAS
jgi:hypothetical protein